MHAPSIRAKNSKAHTHVSKIDKNEISCWSHHRSTSQRSKAPTLGMVGNYCAENLHGLNRIEFLHELNGNRNLERVEPRL